MLIFDDARAAADGYTACEPVAPDTFVLYGTGDGWASTITVNGTSHPISAVVDRTDPDRTYVTWVGDLGHADASWSVTNGDRTWARLTRATTASVARLATISISPLIYGMAFPEDGAYVDTYGVSVARWGGNAVTLYNPDRDVTNHAFDWYFENSTAENAEDWMGSVGPAIPFLTVPALDWVAKDDASCAYSVGRYGSQQRVDPWNPDCGNGIRSDGTPITWNDPTDAATPWSAEQLEAWLAGLRTVPGVVAVDNELEIASSTHQDVHPEPVTYDELAERWYRYAGAVKRALPDVPVAGPSTCAWYFYWNSMAGADDKAAHGGVDLLPWWLGEVAARDAAAGVRTLDYFDVHYYPEGVFNDAVDPATAALRLRATRSLWDPTYTDESWIGTDVWATQTQPNPNQVQLIPRMKGLIDAAYPGTRFALTEWNFGAERDLSGGLAVADVLGILGREGVDLATYWTAPPAGSPAALAFGLYTDPGAGFGAAVLPVTAADPDRMGVYGAIAEDGARVLVVVNKDPDHDLVLALDGFGAGMAGTRGFSPGSPGALVENEVVVDGTVVVPAYGVVLYRLASADTGDTGGTGTGDTGTGDTGDTGGTAGDDPAPKDGGCGCTTRPDGSGVVAGGGMIAVVVLRRRRGGGAPSSPRGPDAAGVTV